jgi:protein-S-isoprenylcysteine O-methyltransferase Ste14
VEAPALGERGQGWVWLQFLLMAVVLALAVLGPRWPEPAARVLAVAGAALVLTGGAVGVWAGRALGPSLTPYPRPSRSGSLVDAGPYRFVRHPIYAAGLLVFAGIALVGSPAALAALAALAAVWALKASVEERFLLARYPAYAEYAGRVRARLVPGVY